MERKYQNLLVYLVSSTVRQYREIHKWELALLYPYLYTGLAMTGYSHLLGIPILFNPSSRDYGRGSRCQITPRYVIACDGLHRTPGIDEFFLLLVVGPIFSVCRMP